MSGRRGAGRARASKVIDAPADRVWAAVRPDGICAWAPAGRLEPSTEEPERVLRGAWTSDGANAPVGFTAALAAAPDGKTRLTVRLSRLPDAEAAEAAKAAWRAALESLKEKLEG